MPDIETCPCGSGLTYDDCCSSSSEYEEVDSIELLKGIFRSDRMRTDAKAIRSTILS